MRSKVQRGFFVLLMAAIGLGCSGPSDPFGDLNDRHTNGADASSSSGDDDDPSTNDGDSSNRPGDGKPSNGTSDAGNGSGNDDGNENDGNNGGDGNNGNNGNNTPPVATKTRKVKDLTGTQTSSGKFAVGGTDLGIAVRQPNGKIAYVFGDTFAGDKVGSSDWRSPVLLRSEPGNLDAGITFNGAAGGSHAKQILDYQHNHKNPDYSTWLPSDVITIGQRMYMHYIVNNGLGNVQWTQIAYSDDNGENWTLSNARWEGGENNSLQQLWTWERGTDGYVYVISTKFISRDKGMILHRVPEGKILDKSAYQPWGNKNGKWAWGNPATQILGGKTGEMCLRRIENKWVLSWFNAGSYNITIKVFDDPTDDLSKAKTYAPVKGGFFENDSTVNQLYGGYIHPDSTLSNLHLIISQWVSNGGPYRSMQFSTSLQ